MGESRLTQPVVFQLPVVAKLQPDMKTHGPIVILPFDRILQRPALRMTLDADVIRLDIIEPGGIHNVRPGRTLNMRGPRSMTFLAADVPFRYSLGLDVVVHRMAAIAKGAGRALEVIAGVERNPPVGTCLQGVRRPRLVGDVPLNGKWKIVVADFLEVALLPDASVDEGDIVLGKR